MSFGAVAQLGERRFCKPEVVGSIPISSTDADARCPLRSYERTAAGIGVSIHRGLGYVSASRETVFGKLDG